MKLKIFEAHYLSDLNITDVNSCYEMDVVVLYNNGLFNIVKDRYSSTRDIPILSTVQLVDRFGTPAINELFRSGYITKEAFLYGI